MVNWKEIAKFASGITAWESVMHGSLLLAGSPPMNIFGIILTPTLNTIQTIVPGVIAILLVYYAWFRK